MTHANGSSFASFLLGAVDTASAYIPLETDYLFYHTGIFAQDDWHITPKLTVSYGIRWDFMPPFSEAHNYHDCHSNRILRIQAQAICPERWPMPEAEQENTESRSRTPGMRIRATFGTRLPVQQQDDGACLFRNLLRQQWKRAAVPGYGRGGLQREPLVPVRRRRIHSVDVLEPRKASRRTSRSRPRSIRRSSMGKPSATSRGMAIVCRRQSTGCWILSGKWRTISRSM